MPPHDAKLEACFMGVILGTAVGDAIGLPREGLSRRRAMKLFGPLPLHHKLLPGLGMISDDTEHTCMVGQALLATGGEPNAFARSLAWKLRWWLLALPAGVGMATARACVKLWLGFPPNRSGVWSAGNGPAMRAAILGVWKPDDLVALRRLVSASTRLTHTDPAAEDGAMAIAIAAAYAVRSGRAITPDGFLDLLRPTLPNSPLLPLIEQATSAVTADVPLADHLSDRGLERGITGYINHTVPAALYCWLRWPGDFRRAVEEIVIAGGDTDSTGAIVGGLVGLSAGAAGIPAEWIDGLRDWPGSASWMRLLARKLAIARASNKTERLPSLWPAVLLRNFLFLLVVLVHGLRRLLPPY